MADLLAANPLLLLFVIGAISWPLGRIKVKGTSLGVAMVLFVGIAVNAIDPRLKLPDIIFNLGAVLFVYTLGLSGGPAFLASFRGKGLRDSAFVAAILMGAAALAVAVHNILQLKPTVTAGLYAGSLTNTPALAGVIQYVKNNSPPSLVDAMMAEPVVGYSIAYPMGVIAMIVCILVMKRLWRVDLAAEARELQALGGGGRKLVNRTICVTRDTAGETLGELTRRGAWDVNFGRLKRDAHGQAANGTPGLVVLADAATRLAPGDLITLVGSQEDVDQVTAYLGEASEDHLVLDRSEFDYRRMFVSNPKIVGQTLRDINLQQQFGAIATRVRRGDVDMLAHDDTVLQLGDRVRVTARPGDMDAISRFFGDSYRALSEIDILTFSLGISLGLLLGMVPIPLPGGLTFMLGFAGGPLIVALILGALGRTGPLIWSLPYSANLTLRQFGLVMFLAGVGTKAGNAFVTTFTKGGGLSLFIAGAVITTVTALVTLWIGYRFLKIKMSVLMGMLAGLQTQPAVLGFALEQTGNDLPNVGYASMFALGGILKIILAQLLVAFLR